MLMKDAKLNMAMVSPKMTHSISSKTDVTPLNILDLFIESLLY